MINVRNFVKLFYITEINNTWKRIWHTPNFSLANFRKNDKSSYL